MRRRRERSTWRMAKQMCAGWARRGVAARHDRSSERGHTQSNRAVPDQIHSLISRINGTTGGRLKVKRRDGDGIVAADTMVPLIVAAACAGLFAGAAIYINA